jgi:hypothetical protein
VRCIWDDCEEEPTFVAAFKPCCGAHLVSVLCAELNPSPDGRRGSTMVPVGFVMEHTPDNAA